MWSPRLAALAGALALVVGLVDAQSSVSLSLSTSSFTSLSRSGSVTVSRVLPTVLNVTIPISATSTASASSASTSPSPSASAVPNNVLATKLDPAFGVLGAVLIITGVPSAFFGHKNRHVQAVGARAANTNRIARWTSFFLIGFYTLSLVCFVLILKASRELLTCPSVSELFLPQFGILTAVNPPSNVLRGLFVLASAVAGIAGGGISIFFWKASRYCTRKPSLPLSCGTNGPQQS
jgi:hypothetical protein